MEHLNHPLSNYYFFYSAVVYETLRYRSEYMHKLHTKEYKRLDNNTLRQFTTKIRQIQLAFSISQEKEDALRYNRQIKQ